MPYFVPLLRIQLMLLYEAWQRQRQKQSHGTGRGRDGSTEESDSETEAWVDSIKTEVNVEQRLWHG
jgi:hypothetical protein